LIAERLEFHHALYDIKMHIVGKNAEQTKLLMRDPNMSTKKLQIEQTTHKTKRAPLLITLAIITERTQPWLLV
jgi:hypothetical protein